jgi:RHS repeat-associated protein
MNAAGNVTVAHEAGGANSLRRIYDRATGELNWVEAEHGSALVFDEQYGYDAWGERKMRTDLLRVQSEHYNYYASSRLKSARAMLPSGNTVATLSATYDNAGNLKSKDDRGGHVGYTYGASGHPNRLTRLSASGSDPGISGGNLSYDAAGRIKAGAGYSIHYNRRGLTKKLQAHGHTATLAYAPDGHRYRMTVDGKTTIYLAGGAFRVVAQSNGTTAYRQAIMAGGMRVAQRVTRSDASTSFQYFYHDGLGSPVAFASFTGVGQPPGLAYGPYGRNREANNWGTLQSGNPLSAYDTRRGYTGGEALAAMGIVVLGARVYVPALGRWLSPDPAGAGSPYVYAGDNPETDIDPTGEINWNSVGKIVGVLAIAAVSYGVGLEVLAAGGTEVEAGAAGGFAGGYAGSGGNLKDGAIGALGGAAMAYFGSLSAFGGKNPTAGQLAEKATVEGLAGGTLSAAATGGGFRSFESGFLGAFAAAEIGGGIMPNSSSGEAIAARTAAMSVLGGTVADIAGGSFANGAISAAFQQLFNEGVTAEARSKIFTARLKYLKSHGLVNDTTVKFKNQFYAGKEDAAGTVRSSLNHLPHYPTLKQLNKFLQSPSGAKYHQLLGYAAPGGTAYVFAGATLGGTFRMLPTNNTVLFNVHLSPNDMTDFTILHELGHIHGLQVNGYLSSEWQANSYAIKAMKGLNEWSY